MKHAILIIAHKNYSFLHHLIEYFERDCYVFVHIDKKSDITKEQMTCLREMPQVAGVYRKYSVHWGGFSILKCELFLLRKAHETCDAEYFHLISGQDYPIKPLETFLDFFENLDYRECIQYVHLPHPQWEKGTYDRFKFYYFFDFVSRNEKNVKRVNDIVAWQKRNGIKRRIPDYFDYLYGCSQWFSITDRGVDIILNYTKCHPAFLRRLRYTFAPEECYIATVLLNKLPSEKIYPKNCRYIRWKKENNNYPANLSIRHFFMLAVSDCLFARKMELPVSAELLQTIDKYLITDAKFNLLPHGGWNYNGFLKYTYSEKLMFVIHKFCVRQSIREVLDLGCGPGYYVQALRALGIAVTGYDANPHTSYLSSLILPKNDDCCHVGDITDEMECESTFGFVICMDVLAYIPHSLWNKAIDNIVSMGNKFILISIDFIQLNDVLNQKEIEQIFVRKGLYLDVQVTELFRSVKHDDERNELFFMFKKQC